MQSKTSKIGHLSVALLLTWAQFAPGQCAEPQDPSDRPAALEFSVLGMSCETCADSAARALSRVAGLTEPAVDFETKKARVGSDGTVTREEIREALATLGFEARFGDEALDSDPLPEAVRAGLDIETVSRGERVRIKKHLAPGKITIFDYYADWCGPCHLLSPKLERLVLKYDNLALRKIDLMDYESEAAVQATREFKLPGLPFTRVFDDRGKLLGQVHGNQAEEIEKIVRSRARLRQPEASQGKIRETTR